MDLDKLRSRYEGQNGVTPKQVGDQIFSSERSVYDEIWNSLHPSVTELFTSRTGREKDDKMRKFYRSLVTLSDEIEIADLIKMTPECVRNDGGINANELRKVIEKIRSGGIDD